MNDTLLPACICGSISAESRQVNGIDVLACACGVVRQHVPMTRDQYRDWYERSYFDGVYYHTRDQDLLVARKRLDEYSLSPGAKLLDIGAGNAAFVHEAHSRGLDAWGQDLARQSDGPRVYVGQFHDIGFPTGSFDIVTMHDVLEHVPDPRAMLREIRRILRPGGELIVDFPRFDHPDGLHHWKPIEHIWFLSGPQLASLLVSEGFEIRATYQPIPSKVVLRCTTKTNARSTRILVPPGIGDGYWVMTRLRAFCESRGIELPEIYVHDKGPRRAGEMWSRLPFVRLGGYSDRPAAGSLRRRHRWTALEKLDAPILERAYRTPDHPLQENVCGFDYFISFNGTMDHGASIDGTMPGPTRWHEPLFRSKAQLAERDAFQNRYGPYVMVAFWEKGFYGNWLADFPETSIVATLRILAEHGLTLVLTGAEWDRGSIVDRIASADPRFVSLVGETSFEQLAALLEGATAVLGFPAGSTLLGPYYRRPTVLLWNRHFPEAMWRNACPPEPTYRPLDTYGATPATVAATLLEMVR